MKVHVGTKTGNGFVHSLSTTAVNVHDSQELDNLLQGEETVVYGDSAYASTETKELHEALGVKWRVHHKAAAGHSLSQKKKPKTEHEATYERKTNKPFGPSSIFGSIQGALSRPL